MVVGEGAQRPGPAASPQPARTAGASDIERFLAAFCSRSGAVVEAARKLLSDERGPRRQKLLADLIHNLSENILAEDREDDKKWFEGALCSAARRERPRGSARSRESLLRFYCSKRTAV